MSPFSSRVTRERFSSAQSMTELMSSTSLSGCIRLISPTEAKASLIVGQYPIAFFHARWQFPRHDKQAVNTARIKVRWPPNPAGLNNQWRGFAGSQRRLIERCGKHGAVTAFNFDIKVGRLVLDSSGKGASFSFWH